MCFPFADLYSHLPPKLDTRNSCRIRILPGPVTGVTCSLLGYDGSRGLPGGWAIMTAHRMRSLQGRRQGEPEPPPGLMGFRQVRSGRQTGCRVKWND